MLAGVKKWFSRRETEKKTVPLHAPDSSRDLARSAKPTEPQRIRWVNEDVSRQHIPGQLPDQNPVSKPGNAIRPGVAPNASTEVTNSPRTMAEQQAQKRVSTGYDVTASSEDGNGAPRTYGAAGVNKPRSAPVVRNNGVTGPNVPGFREQSAGASKVRSSLCCCCCRRGAAAGVSVEVCCVCAAVCGSFLYREYKCAMSFCQPSFVSIVVNEKSASLVQRACMHEHSCETPHLSVSCNKPDIKRSIHSVCVQTPCCGIRPVC